MNTEAQTTDTVNAQKASIEEPASPKVTQSTQEVKPAFQSTVSKDNPTQKYPEKSNRRRMRESILEAKTIQMSVSELKDIERFKLFVWIAKLVMLSMTGIVLVSMTLYGYTAYVTKSMPDMGVFGTLFGHLKDVLVVVIDAQK